jgi:nucleoside phosphorylase
MTDLEVRLITASVESKSPKPIPWPQGLAPTPVVQDAADTDPLPKADVLIVTYTVAEGYALSDILTPGVHSTEWTPYRNNWPAIKSLIEGGRAPALESDCAGYWALTKIGDVTAVLVKSELHPSTDGPKVPIVTAWQQWIDQVQPKLVITTGTAGAVQGTTLLGDVVVSKHVTWDCKRQFKNQPFAGKSFHSAAHVEAGWFVDAEHHLIPINADSLPAPYYTGRPRVWVDSSHPAHVISTDFFAFDDTEDTYGLRTFDKSARAVEMDDAALAYALEGVTDPPPWLIVRNASDPQMSQADLPTETKQAASIYQKWGLVTSWGSAICCWVLCTQLQPKPGKAWDGKEPWPGDAVLGAWPS